MWPFDNSSADGVAQGAFDVPIWLLALAALSVALLVVAVVRTRSSGVLVLAVLAAVGGWGIWAWSNHERAEERRAFEARIVGLDAHAMLPGSALACLDAPLGEMLEMPCERSVFANPETAAGAVAATASRVALLREGVVLATRVSSLEDGLERLRGPLQRDPFGLVAHVLATREGCTPEHCDALRLLREDARVLENLAEHRFDMVLARHAGGWGKKPETPPEAPSPAVTGSLTRAPLPPNYNLPSAASIPPVSIMSPEPAASAPPATAAQASPSPKPARPPRQPRPPQARAQPNPTAAGGPSRAAAPTTPPPPGADQ